MKPRLLDLYCGAGGCAAGYQMAGFHVTGVDIKPQKRYCGDEFVQADALEYLSKYGRRYSVIHASPPCQAYSATKSLWKRERPDLIAATRNMLKHSGKPYIIENVPGSPLLDPIMLCGTMFGLNTIRHRLFEIWPFTLPAIRRCNHIKPVAKFGRRPVRDKEYITVVGHFSDIQYAREAMGINWMVGSELSQAIPPAYTRWIGYYLIQRLKL